VPASWLIGSEVRLMATNWHGEWDKAVKDATKVLGDKGKIPKWSTKIDKAGASEDKAYDSFDKVRQELKTKLVADQDACGALKDAFSQFQDEIVESNLGLNPKDKDEKKKIDDARAVLSGKLQQWMDTEDDNFKNLKELDKHLMSLINYAKSS
jgi:hypothetical protein